ncbi:scarecrow-like protein 6 [Oryza brachyantha]|uniref:scarecrow-like protein 6 n=1 Tax=Oryza brachyantha TaxID=4533 RepID=UPI001AD9E974|nr:scarecrow-like protein 6 [Oryza brachyantha]
MRAALFGAERSGVADLAGIGGNKELFWPAGKGLVVEPRSVLDCTRSPSPRNSTSTLSSSQGGGGGGAGSTGVAAVSESSAAAAEATKWGAPGEHGGGGGGKEDWSGGCELPPIPGTLDVGLVGGEGWDAMLSNTAAAGQDQSFLNWIIGAAGDLEQPGPPLIDNAGFGIPAVDPLGFSLDHPLSGVASNLSSSGAHTATGGGGKASLGFGLFPPEATSLEQPPHPMLFHEGIDTKPSLLGGQPPGLLNQYHHQPPNPAATFFMPLPSFPEHNHQSPLLQPPPKRHHAMPDDLYLARNQLPAAAQGLPFSPLHASVPFQLQRSPQPPRGAMKTTAAEAAQQQLLDELAAAAKATEAGNSVGAREILARLNQQLPPLGKPFLRSASYFREALLLALADGHHGASSVTSPLDVALKLAAYKSFSDLSPVLQFANFTATQALLDEIGGTATSCIHVIDFDLGVGGQWASFLQELAHRRGAGGVTLPLLKLTAFVSTASHHPLELHLTQDNLSQFAADLGIPFEFNAVSLDAFNPTELISSTGDEVVAVSLPVGCSARSPPLPAILRLVKQLNPKIVVAIDHGADRADLSFSQHFLNCFQSCVFLLDSLDAAGIDSDSACKIERFLIQPRVHDTVLGRHKGHKAMAWRSVFAAAGFKPVPPSNLAEAQADCLLKRVQVRGFHVEKRGAALMLYWQRGELVSISSWRC